MGKYDKLLTKILIGRSDADIPFSTLCNLLEQLGFDMRIRGSHHIFTKFNVDEIINLQPKRNKAKAYQLSKLEVLLSNTNWEI